MRIVMRGFVALALVASLTSHRSPVVQAQMRAEEPPLTNSDIIKLVKARMGDGLVVTSIQTAPKAAFVLTADAMIELRAAGVSDAVITAMLNRMAAGAALPANHVMGGIAGRDADLSNPLTPRRGGIYVEVAQSETRLVPLDTIPIGETKTRPGFYSATTKIVFRPARAGLRLNNSQPSFYFYFPPDGTGSESPGALAHGVSNPNEFILAHMKAQSDSRELKTGKAGLGGYKGGISSDDKVETKTVEVAPGIYKVTPLRPLRTGEYGFIYAVLFTAEVPLAAAKVFEFGVDVPKAR